MLTILVDFPLPFCSSSRWSLHCEYKTNPSIYLIKVNTHVPITNYYFPRKYFSFSRSLAIVNNCSYITQMHLFLNVTIARKPYERRLTIFERIN